ncbi:MAG: MFS transporter [Candidatus Gottesmanbacteria bacterium]
MTIPHVLKNKQFVKLWISQACSIISLNLLIYTLILRLFEQTNSTLAATFLWIAYSLPIILSGPFAATIVDLLNRKKLLVVSTLLLVGAMLSFLFVGSRFFLYYALIFCYSFVNQFYLPAESATMPSLVKTEDLPEANGFFLLSKQAGMLVGFGLAGFFAKFVGFPITIIVGASVLAIAFLSVMTLPKLNGRKPVDVEKQLGEFFSKVVEGYQYIKNNRSILYPVLLLLGGEMTMTIVAVNIPALAKNVFGIAIEDVALFIVIPALLGAMFGVTIVSRLLKKKLIRKKIAIQYSLFTIAIAFFLLAIAPGHLSETMQIIVLPVLAISIGFGFVGIQVPSQTFMQESTPNDMMGRLWGNLWFLMTIAAIIPMFLSASITEFLGADILFIILAIGMFIAAISIKKVSFVLTATEVRPN